MSGSTDGLVNVYDLKQAKKDSRDTDDDEALFQVINHGSSIHHTGFLRSAAPRSELMDIYALSHDEILTVYPLNDASTISDEFLGQEEEEGEEKSVWGDVRQKLGCEYVVNLLPEASGRGGTLAVGSHQQQWVDLMPFENDWNGKDKKGRMSGWRIDRDRGIRLAGGHGEEVVRCIHILQDTRTIYTGGEDGLVKVWGGQEQEPAPEGDLEEEEPQKQEKPKIERTREKKKHNKKNRTRPY